LNKKILLIAALITAISSAAYACTYRSGVTSAALSIALLGAHGGGPLGMLLVIATPVNFFLYLALGLAMRKVARLFTKPST